MCTREEVKTAKNLGKGFENHRPVRCPSHQPRLRERICFPPIYKVAHHIIIILFSILDLKLYFFKT